MLCVAEGEHVLRRQNGVVAVNVGQQCRGAFLAQLRHQHAEATRQAGETNDAYVCERVYFVQSVQSEEDAMGWIRIHGD